MTEEPRISFEDLREIAITILLITGDHDVIDLEHRREIKENLPNST